MSLLFLLIKTSSFIKTTTMDSATQSLHEIALQVASELEKQQKRIVFAESCTSGLLAVVLGRIPGISNRLCGSAVTYREATKSGWLCVDAELLEDPTITAVSKPVAIQMVSGVLKITPEADLAVSVTGHLGPDAPEGSDGLAYVAILKKGQAESDSNVLCFKLPKSYPNQPCDTSLRILRQEDLVTKIMSNLLIYLEKETKNRHDIV